MAISRSLMNRQLQANGGIMQVTPRENFGIGSSIKKFVRKIIPNEVSEIAVKAAPFVAPFNPALAGAMAGIGSFDQTGSIGDSLKRGALTYGGGQAARYIGGAGFQGNPFASGGAFTPSGFTQGFSSPLGSETGLGKFFSNRGTTPVEGVQVGDEFAVEDLGSDNFSDKLISKTDVDLGSDTFSDNMVFKNTPEKLKEKVTEKVVASTGSPNQMTITDSIKKIISPDSTLGERGNEALNLLKRGTKAAFTKSDGKGGTVIDKAAIMGAAVFASSYVEAKALAADVGVDLTQEEYDEAKKAEKKEEYANYLTNFFAGKKDGGRIGFKDGYSPEIVKKALKEYNSVYGIDGSGEEILVKDLYSGGFDEFLEIFARDNRAQGGRIGFKLGSEPEESEIGIMAIDVEAGDDEDEENDLMAGITFSSAEKSYLFRRLAGNQGSDRSYTMPNLYRILSNPNRYPNDAAILKEIAIMGMKKDGGRIGYAGGANRVSELLVLRDSMLAKDADADVSDIEAELFQLTGKTFRSIGGIGDVPTGKLTQNKAGVIERDYRDEGGFVPVGIKERADDVPAMLSKNEFVMTADAVRGIGNGSVEEGSKKLYNTMKQAEQVGKA